MSAAVYQYEWKTDPSTQLRGTLAQNVGVDLDLIMSGAATVPNPTTLAGVNGDTRGSLRSLTIVSVQNLAWELWLWESATHKTLAAAVTAAGSNIIGRWSFAAADGITIGAGADFVYYIDGLDVPIFDADNSAKLHLTLVNKSAAGKLANDAGAIQVKGRIAQPVY